MRHRDTATHSQHANMCQLWLSHCELFAKSPAHSRCCVSGRCSYSGGCTNEFLAPPSSAGPFLFLATLVSCCQPHCGPRVIHCHLPWYPSTPPIPSLRVQVLDFCWTYLPSPHCRPVWLGHSPMLQKCSGVSSQSFRQASRPREDALTRVSAFFIVCQQLNYWLIGTQNG